MVLYEFSESEYESGEDSADNILSSLVFAMSHSLWSKDHLKLVEALLMASLFLIFDMNL